VDQVVHDPRAFRLGGVDVGDAAGDCFAEHRDRAVVVLRRADDPGAGELHRDVPEPADDAIAECPGAAGESCGDGVVHGGVSSRGCSPG